MAGELWLNSRQVSEVLHLREMYCHWRKSTYTVVQNSLFNQVAVTPVIILTVLILQWLLQNRLKLHARVRGEQRNA
jgi:hypothetical protein